MYCCLVSEAARKMDTAHNQWCCCPSSLILWTCSQCSQELTTSLPHCCHCYRGFGMRSFFFSWISGTSDGIAIVLTICHPPVFFHTVITLLLCILLFLISFQPPSLQVTLTPLDTTVNHSTSLSYTCFYVFL